tara:strand:+ start:5821 stop:6438 length:618 start_codon:yes stop_codon:yes gene_type:complete
MVNVGLLGALKRELPKVVHYNRLKHVYKIGKYDVGIFLSGVGSKKAEKATERLCTKFNPDYIIFVGFCGCVDPEVNLGTLLVAGRVHYKGEEESLEGPELEHVKRCLTNSSIDYKVGKFQTFDSPRLSKEGVLEGVIGVDMEAYAIVSKAKEYKVPTIVVKSVSDILSEKKYKILPIPRLIGRILLNFKTAKKGLNDFGKNYFTP